jgi:hypothetical protein
MAKTKRTLEGSVVRLLRDVTRRDGFRFKKGVKMRVTSVAVGGRGGKISLGCYKRGWYHFVMGLSSADFEVIEWAREEYEKHDFGSEE